MNYCIFHQVLVILLLVIYSSAQYEQPATQSGYGVTTPDDALVTHNTENDGKSVEDWAKKSFQEYCFGLTGPVPAGYEFPWVNLVNSGIPVDENCPMKTVREVLATKPNLKTKLNHPLI